MIKLPGCFGSVPQLLDDAFHFLVATPLAGKACDHIKTGYRKFPQASHIFFYKAGAVRKIEIVRVLHKSMDVDLKFDNP